MGENYRLIRRAVLLLHILVLVAMSTADAQNGAPLRKQRIIILLSASESMLEPWEGNLNRFQAASQIIVGLMDSLQKIDSRVEFGLRVYGHQYPADENSCFDSKLEVGFSGDNRVQMGLRLKSIAPKGISTIAYALSECTSKDIGDGEDYLVVLITDSPESCSKDFCPMAKALKERTQHEPFVICLQDDRKLKQTYDCLGRSLFVPGAQGIPIAIKRITEIYRRPQDKVAKGFGYIKVRNPDQVSSIELLYKTRTTFTRIQKGSQEIIMLVSGKAKVATGSYRIVYFTGTEEAQSREIEVTNDMITEVELK